MNNDLKQDVLRILSRHYMFVVDKYCDILKERVDGEPINDIMRDFETELLFVEDTAKKVQNLAGTA